ncbi:MAG: hypothetical protein HY259_04670 [Chloroflexi bacterium]|nr:hypothetical protein [Chloroflexota bacterium]
MEDTTTGVLTFAVDSNAPLAGARLVLGIEGGRQPMTVPVTTGATHASWTLNPRLDRGLAVRLPRGMSTLRYNWLVQSSGGETLSLADEISSPSLEAEPVSVDMQWLEERSGKLTFYYLADTPAARDIEALKSATIEGIAHAARALDVEPDQRLTVYWLPRVFWQGGAAFGDRTIFISYADRAFTGVPVTDYLTHEGAHALTQDWGNLGAAGGLLAEGVAVYATGGHYRPDVIDESVAAIAQSPLFIPPSVLRRDFSAQQHEIAYTESASFVKFLIDGYGLKAFRALMQRPNDWRVIYGKDFDALAQDWLSAIRARPGSAETRQRWELKVRFYDLMRQYEERLDPGARRLPSVPVARWDAAQRQALSAPAEAELNQVLELVISAAVEAIDHGQNALAARDLDELEQSIREQAVSDRPLTRDTLAIVRLLHAQDDAILQRDWDALLETLDQASYPQFAAQTVQQARAQPAWLRFRQSPVSLVISGDRAWLTAAQWAEPLDLSKAASPNGVRSVLALRRDAATGQWRVMGRWPDAQGLLMSGAALRQAQDAALRQAQGAARLNRPAP